MSTSVNELKARLRSFLGDPSQEADFRVWFAGVLRNAHRANSLEFESLAHTVQRAFSDASEGLYTPDELMEFLTELSEERVPASQLVPFYFSGGNLEMMGESEPPEPAKRKPWAQSNLWPVESH